MATGPWSVKGIDPRAREAAKAAAQREGLTLGEWMNRRLLDDVTPHMQNPGHGQNPYAAPGSVSYLSSSNNNQNLHSMIEELSQRLEAAERRSTLAITGIDQSVLGMLTRLEGVEKVHSNVTGKLEDSLQSLEGLAAKSHDEIDRMVRKVDRAAEDSARRIDTVAEHTDLQLGRARHELSKELELVNNRSDELSQRLGVAERMTDNAVRSLETSFASVDERLRKTEKNVHENSAQSLSDTFNKRFKTLSEELIHVVAQTRGQLAAQIEAQAATPRLEQFESSLRDVRAHLADSERRHADTLERIASEVGKLGGAIEHRFSEAERNTAIGLDKMLDARFTEFQNDHAAAIDKIGDGLTGAISRLEEKFNTIEEKRNVEDSLEARIIASEERTAKMVEDALERIHDRLDAKNDPEEKEDSPVQRAMLALAERLEALERTNDAPPPFDPTHSTDAKTADDRAASQTQDQYTEPDPALEEILRPPESFGEGSQPSLPPLSSDFGPELSGDYGSNTPDNDGEDYGAPYPDPHDGVPEALIAPVYAPPEDGHYAPVGATADANFVAAARRSVRVPGAQSSRAQDGQAKSSGGSKKLLVTASVIAIIAIIGAGGMTFMDFGNFGTGSQKPATKSAAIANAGFEAPDTSTDPSALNQPAAAPESLTTADAQDIKDTSVLDGADTPKPAQSRTATMSGQVTSAPKPVSKPAQRPARTARQTPSVSKPQIPKPQRQASVVQSKPRAQPTIAVSTTPLAQQRTIPVAQTTSTTGRLTIQQAAANGDPVAQFQLASAKLDAGDTQGGIKLMQQAANRGLPIAQYRLGKLYEDGTGVAKDSKEGRRWTERAANGGNRRAMHNLAMMYAEGNGVPQNYEIAAKWFQEAARMGLTNSQYNLAFLYEQGLGIPESLTQAYAWYSIAAKAGDEGAKTRADEIGATLAQSAKNEAATIIASFRPRPLDLAANGIFRNVSWARPQLNTAPSIARAQILLARLGYKPGPADGNPGAATRKAIIAYERDQGLAQTGRIDATLLAKLENSAIN